MKTYSALLIGANLIFFLGLFNYEVAQKEQLLSEGKLVLLELAPVDPRSLMQGDYMDLRYAISENTFDDSIPKRGYVVLKLDSLGVGQKVRLQENTLPRADDELAIGYRLKGWGEINIGAESYFFQEGEGEKYESAKYGGVKVDVDGNSILVGLFDANQNKIE
ncbi:GDYXXLXY domain-containing protein [Flagellimonas meishanensis]|uniref:GDYXXLXY domain-containing protein n=1 Tax=Flagellimonas meishanensis TaxID=2873264 RepID=UPI001CA70BEE|nr:GDYXXLXY domain-containing protein [[Muricauda] meishanensis]